MRKLFIKLIRGYQKYLSPLKTKPTCRFYPTCSQYAIMAIEKYGLLKGIIKSVWRVLRCNPFNPGGIDYP
ncbi:MAG: membrane protein insertion efficiency factor YidD [Clostridiales bacterium]|nr:membrane protein insertion efficiency factor YidD [Clostridiales bacterium]